MSAHTPGPWSLSAPNTICYVQGPNGEYIMRRDSRATFDKIFARRVEADCRLIAAAPELLEALQTIAAELDGEVAETWIVDMVNEAIAKATGEAA